MRSMKNALVAMVFCALLASCIKFGPPPRPIEGKVTVTTNGSATLPMLVDDNRLFVEMEVLRPDGSVRKLLAFVNMGQPAPNISTGLYHDLGIDQGKALELRFGTLPIRIDATAVQPSDGAAQLFAPLPAEMMLPAGVLQNFEVVLDYGKRTMTLAAPGTLKPEGIPVPMALNPGTGLVTLATMVDGKPYKFVIDNGGSYSVFRAETVEAMLKGHPEWLRASSAIGEANNSIDNTGFDSDSPVLKLPYLTAGGLTLDTVGVNGAGMGTTLGTLVGPIFWNQYSDKAGLKVDGWLGGNVLSNYRLTIDYAQHMTWWLKVAPTDSSDLNQVGVTLGRDQKGYKIAAIAHKNGQPTVNGVEPGDLLVAVDGLKTQGATRGQVLTSLHGVPGERRHLVLERAGKRVEVDAKITAF